VCITLYRTIMVFWQQDARIQAEQRQKDTKIKLEQAEKAIQEMEQQLEALQHARDAVDSQARTDKKLLAKEVRLLRHSQNELKMEAAHALEAKAALELSLQEEKRKQDGIRAVRSKFLYEMAMLRKRLQECSMEFLTKEDNIPASKNGVSAGMINAFELLSTSDNHIDLLLAEVGGHWH
jgi:chromosome segregation ATPase